MYAGAWGKGVGLAIAALLLIMAMVYSIFGATGNTLVGLGLVLGLVAVYGLGLWDSYRTLGRQGRLPTPADPWYPVLLSHVLPGMGQLYRQQAMAAVLFLVAGIGTAYLANFEPRLLPLPPLVWAIACGHAYDRKKSRKSGHWPLLMGFLTGLIIVRLAVGSIPVWVRLAVEQCIVPSESMVPTLQVGDRIFVSKAAGYQPSFQDIVVFTGPPQAQAIMQLQPEDLLVKRVIGLPGQTVAVQNGQVLVDGSAIAEPYIAAAPDYGWGPETVPPDQFFVLGDNRNFSGDSHVWGFLPRQNILGKAYKIYWPPARIQPLP